MKERTLGRRRPSPRGREPSRRLCADPVPCSVIDSDEDSETVRVHGQVDECTRYSAAQKERNPSPRDNMDGLEGIRPSEISQTEKDKCRMSSLIYGI